MHANDLSGGITASWNLRGIVAAGIILFLATAAACETAGTGAGDAPGTERAEEPLKELDWLLGRWARLDVKPGQTAFETWSKTSHREFAGLGCILEGEDTVFVDTMGLTLVGDSLFYSAKVSHNEGAVFFEVTQIHDHGFVSENPAHDFPTQIAYQVEGDRLTVVISGGDKAIPFRFARLPEDEERPAPE